MIPTDLLRYKLDNRNYKIYPVLCSIEQNSKDLELANQVIQAFDYCYNHRLAKEKLDQSLKDLEITYKDYKLVRGLATILERRCIFGSLSQPHSNVKQSTKNVPLNQIHDTRGSMKNLTATEIRKIVFDEAAAKGIAINENKRKFLLENISSNLKTSPDMLTKMMWSDQDENSVMNEFLPISQDKLLLMYNISLIQTLLFGCLKVKLVLDVTSSAGTIWKRVLREVKRLGLMYWLEADSSEQEGVEESNNKLTKKKRIVCTIEGALNVLKLTDRYGTAIAKIFPIIMTADRWEINADILRITHSGKKIVYVFEISQNSYPNSIPPSSSAGFNVHENFVPSINDTAIQSPTLNQANSENKKYDSNNLNRVILDEIKVDTNTSSTSKILFDSKIESIFQEQFELFKTGWTIEREPEPLITKQKTAFIPDFVFSKYNYRVIVEIIGFWTKEYLERKLSKIYDIIKNKSKEESFYMVLVINHENLMSYEITDSQKLAQVRGNSNVLITSYKRDKIFFKDIISFLKNIDKYYLNDELLNESSQSTLIRNVTKFLEKFRTSDNNIISMRDLEESLKKEHSESIFLKIKLMDLIEKNLKIKKQFTEKLINSNLLLINDFLLKEEFTKDILNDIKRMSTVGEAGDLMISKGLPEKIHIDLLTFLGFNIEWNSLDFSNAKIDYKE